jgi:SNF2 family DNA or RNA helicase
MWELDYDGALLLRAPKEATDSLQSSSFYKLSLRRYVREVLPGFVRFKPALTYLDYKKVIALCKKEADKQKLLLVVCDTLREYIESRELHIDARSRLGVELKEHHPKLQERFDNYRSIVDKAMSRKLRDRQAWDSFFMCAMQKSANFSVPGSGKTASVLGMYAYLREKELVKRILVICPKNAFGSWMDEFSVCFDGIEPLRVLNIHNPAYKNTRQRNAALQYDSGRYNLILVNYESVGGVLNSLLQLLDKQTLLVFDEVHKVKRVNGEYAENALRLSREACYAVAMTGTPIPNSYTDIYNLLHILFPHEYDEFFDFTVPMLRKPGTSDVKEINDKLQPFFCRTTKDQLGVPKANGDMLCVSDAKAEETKLLQILQMKYRKNKLALLVRILQMESNPKLLLQTLDLADFAYLLDDSVDVSEIDYVDYSEEVKSLIEACGTTTKFKHCIEIASSLADQKKPVIIWCMFVDSIQRLSAELEKMGIGTRCIYGEVPLDERQQILTDFRNGKIQVLLTNPHTLAESVSLHSVCHDAIYFEYSYNLVHLLQSKDRIHRLGLPEGQYTQYYFEQLSYRLENGEWSLGTEVYNRLKLKEQIMLDAIDNHVLEALPTSEEDLEIIFSKL